MLRNSRYHARREEEEEQGRLTYTCLCIPTASCSMVLSDAIQLDCTLLVGPLRLLEEVDLYGYSIPELQGR